MPERLFVLHEAGRNLGTLLISLGRDFDVEPVVLEEDDLAEVAEATCFLDVDLSDGAVVTRLRRSLPRRGAWPRIAAIEPSARAERVQAGVLGATAFVTRPYAPEAVAAKVCEHVGAGALCDALGRGDVPSGVAGRGSLLAAEAALNDLFAACVGGDMLDFGLVGEAASEVTATIRDLGFDRWMDTVRRHHGGTYQHCMLVTGIAVGFGVALGMSTPDVDRLAQAGLMHDVGKALVPVELLDKPGRLTAAERAIVQEHPTHGWEHLTRVAPTLDPDILHAVRHHHEMLDGSGYPHGLRGAEIPDMTRILTICDIYGALSERRAYKPPMPKADILSVLANMAMEGKLEPALVQAFAWISDAGRPAGRVAVPLLRRA